MLIRGFLAANPDLDNDEQAPIEMMTDRYTNAEWQAQINETTKHVLKEVESGVRAAKVYEGVDRPLTADDVAACIALTVALPLHVNVDQLVVRPLAQAAA